MKRFPTFANLVLLPFLCSALTNGLSWDSPLDFLNRVQRQFDDFVRQVDVESFTDYYSDGHRFVQVVKNRTDGSILKCDMIGDKGMIETILGIPPKTKAQEIKTANAQLVVNNSTQSEMNKIIDSCMIDISDNTVIIWKNFLDKINPLRVFKELSKYVFIFPGTKWCGKGDVASGYDDLGPAREADMCCRDHDNAPEDIAVGESKYGLANPLSYTITRCMYDHQLYHCLGNASTLSSNGVGVMYFDLLRTKCFELAKPATCARPSIFGLCEQYQYDEAGAEDWQIMLPKLYRISFMSNNQKDQMNEAEGIAQQLQKLGAVGDEWKEAMTVSLGDLGKQFTKFHEQFMKRFKDMGSLFADTWNGIFNRFAV